jgi:hypothetical protein
MLRSGAGIVVDSPRHVEAVVSAMEQLADSERRRPFSNACLRVADQLSTDHHVDRLLETYAGILLSETASPTLPLRVMRPQAPSRALPPSPQEDTAISVAKTSRPSKKAA